MTAGSSSTTPQLKERSASLRKAWISVAAIGVAVGGLALAAPAEAAVHAITVAPGPSFGTSAQHGSGCTYKVTIAADPGTDLVHFWDSAPAAFSRLSPVPAEKTIEILWTPLGPGPHEIRAFQGAQSVQVEPVEVVIGHDLGSSCLALPF